jgi:C4-dicarboxylate transporter DctM subunit
LWDARYGLGAPAVILGGIYSGIFTPTEASAIAVVYCLLVEKYLTRGILWRDLPRLLVRSGCVTGIIAPIIAFSILFAEVLAVLRIPERSTNFLLSLPSGHVSAVLMMLVILIVGCCLLDAIAAIIILMPILLPIANGMQFDPVHLGVFVMCGLTIGFIMPPVGLNLFAASAVSGVSFMAIAWRAWPLFVALVLATIVVAFVPWLSIWFK